MDLWFLGVRPYSSSLYNNVGVSKSILKDSKINKTFFTSSFYKDLLICHLASFDKVTMLDLSNLKCSRAQTIGFGSKFIMYECFRITHSKPDCHFDGRQRGSLQNRTWLTKGGNIQLLMKEHFIIPWSYFFC